MIFNIETVTFYGILVTWDGTLQVYGNVRSRSDHTQDSYEMRCVGLAIKPPDSSEGNRSSPSSGNSATRNFFEQGLHLHLFRSTKPKLATIFDWGQTSVVPLQGWAILAAETVRHWGDHRAPRSFLPVICQPCKAILFNSSVIIAL